MKVHVAASTTRASILFANGTKDTATAKDEYTKNESKYRAILLAIHVAKSRNINLTEVVSDSQLVVAQLNGARSVNELRLRELAETIWKRTGAVYVDGTLMKQGDVAFTYVKRADNPARRV